MPVLGTGAISILCIQKYKGEGLSERTVVWLLWEGKYKYSEEKRGIVYSRTWSPEAADLAWALNCEIMDAWWMIPGQGQGERIYLWPLGLKYQITYWSTSALLLSSPPSLTPQHDVHFAGSLRAQAGTEASGQQPQGSQVQCWVGAGSLPRKWWGWGCWLCSSSDLQNPFSICSIKHAVVLCCAGWSSLMWQSGADVFSTSDNLLVPRRCTSWLLHFTFSCRHKWTAKWQRMGLFLLISTEFPLLPSSEKEIIATRFYLRITVNWVL